MEIYEILVMVPILVLVFFILQMIAMLASWLTVAVLDFLETVRFQKPSTSRRIKPTPTDSSRSTAGK